MRIAYIAPFQGAQLLGRRPSKSNLALAGNLKIELISELLSQTGHEVEIISQGEVVERSARYFPAFMEQTSGSCKVPVHYSSALPIRFVNGAWSSRGVVSLLKARHAVNPFDVAIVYNLKLPQVKAALYADEVLGLPFVVEFEDDSFVDREGEAVYKSLKARRQRAGELKVLRRSAGSICVSPHLQTRFPPDRPSMLLRGVISDEVTDYAGRSKMGERRNIVAYSGTLFRGKGLEPLIEAWKSLDLPGWELHIAGDGQLATELHRQAEGVTSIKFRGLLNRSQNAEFLAESRIGINPHNLSATPGNVFAFKIVEYLAAGLHVISTPMGPLESELESGMTYIEDNSPARIASALRDVIQDDEFNRLAADAAVNLYGGESVAAALDELLHEVIQ